MASRLVLLLLALAVVADFGYAQPEPFEARVAVLNDREMYDALLYWLPRANSSIHIIMYVFKSDTDVIERLLETLISKAREGVDVRVVLEGHVDENELTYRRLMANGVMVRFDSRAHTTHCKLVIIDGYLVFVGSHNWTYSAMRRNHEASVMVVSEEVGRLEEEYFAEVWMKG